MVRCQDGKLEIQKAGKEGLILVLFAMPVSYAIGEIQQAAGFIGQLLHGHMFGMQSYGLNSVCLPTCLRVAEAGYPFWCSFHECQPVTSHFLDNDGHPLQR